MMEKLKVTREKILSKIDEKLDGEVSAQELHIFVMMLNEVEGKQDFYMESLLNTIKGISEASKKEKGEN